MSFFNIDNSKSYAKEATLDQKINETFGPTARYLTVRNRSGRFTAIFPLGWNRELLGPGQIAHAGFMVVS